MIKLFVSYRREDSAFAHRLVEYLGERLEADIFLDLKSIDEADFVSVILKNLYASDAMLLVISERTFSDRIHLANDWVRREIRIALEREIPLVLACDGGRLPPSDLPDDIKAVTRKHGINFYPDYFECAVDKLAIHLAKITHAKLTLLVKGLAYFLPAERSALTSYYDQYAEKSDEVDIITLSMEAFLNNYGEPKLAEWILSGKKFRILVLSPDSEAVKIRGREEGNDLSSKIDEQIKRLKDVLGKIIQDRIDARESCAGSLEVRRYDGIPYFAYFRTKEAMIVGLYCTHRRGLQSHSIYIDALSPVFTTLQDHFDTLWKQKENSQPPETRRICKIDASGVDFSGWST